MDSGTIIAANGFFLARPVDASLAWASIRQERHPLARFSSLASVRFDVAHQCVVGGVFAAHRELKQQIEPREIFITLKDGVHLLIAKGDDLVERIKEKRDIRLNKQP